MYDEGGVGAGNGEVSALGVFGIKTGEKARVFVVLCVSD